MDQVADDENYYSTNPSLVCSSNTYDTQLFT